MVPETTHTRALRLGLAFRICGTLILLVGIGSLVLGPVEMVCFTWFEAGGRFAYDGFGFGSFMFGNIAMQILGYYLIAAVLIPLGYGHLTLRRWVPSVTLALVWCWVVFGVPLLIVLLFILLATKELSVGAGTAAAFLAVLSYAALPGLLIRLYRSRRAQAAFGIPGPHPDVFSRWVESQSVPVLVVVGLEALSVVFLHNLLFFNGLFPLPGGWATGLPGYVRVDAAILGLLVIGWGTVRRRSWAWWASLTYFAVMLVLWVTIQVSTSWQELLEVLAFPLYELAFLAGIPLQGWHLAVFVGAPLAGTLVAILRAYESWGNHTDAESTA